MKANKDEIKAWLTRNGKDRDWLANQLNTTKSVVDSWFSSRGFPSERLAAINALMLPEDNTPMIRVPFTDEQLRRTNRAAQIVSSEFQEYCQRAIAAQFEQDLMRVLPPALKDAIGYDEEGGEG